MLTSDFEHALRARFRRAEADGLPSVEINAGELHRALGGYPGPDHRMPALCQAMWNAASACDRVIAAPPKKKGASLTIRYRLPRGD